MARAGLSPSIVIAEAARVADEIGYDRLTLAAVAQRVGVALPSLYKHVRGLDDLRVGLATLATRELADRLSDAALGRAGEDALRSVAHAYRRFATARPGLYAASQRAPAAGDPDHAAATHAALRVMQAVMAGYGLTGDAAIDAIRGVRSALHGFVSLEASGGFGLPRDLDQSFDWLIHALNSALLAPGTTGGPVPTREVD